MKDLGASVSQLWLLDEPFVGLASAVPLWSIMQRSQQGEKQQGWARVAWQAWRKRSRLSVSGRPLNCPGSVNKASHPGLTPGTDLWLGGHARRCNREAKAKKKKKKKTGEQKIPLLPSNGPPSMKQAQILPYRVSEDHLV
ncbi:hypothetical protein MAPG_02149 [Magnaporthiopsis poae ATCC 64411]|uniref:Uncharacterized protein n=1 Tax=Magnaporthiopsis poae (strain ATCC 64411 / 73-15) TaxID=644358 RepID=A0A0C4DQK5_MAGP6|nr:hypothetical protein MAPG_02149 [Magnaporthiopsis poae ATCC 64411]